MSFFELPVGDDEFADGFIAAAEAFTDGVTYAPLVDECCKAIVGGKHTALYVPGVQFVVRTTLGMLSQPDVAQRLPDEIIYRGILAGECAFSVAELAVELGTFRTFYTNHYPFSELPLTPAMERALDTPEPFGTLSTAPFADATVVGGGAFCALRKEGTPGDPADIIARSSGLLVYSGISKLRHEAVSRYLGGPYAQPDNFEIYGPSGNPAVRFTGDARAYLRSQSVGGGCAAGYVESPQDPNISLLKENWDQLIHYLIPPQATAKIGAR